VREFVADDVEGVGEVGEEGSAVAKDHFAAVPEGVFVIFAKVHTSDQDQAFVVDGVTFEYIGVKLIYRTQVLKAVDDRMLNRRGGRLGIRCDQCTR